MGVSVVRRNRPVCSVRSSPPPIPVHAAPRRAWPRLCSPIPIRETNPRVSCLPVRLPSPCSAGHGPSGWHCRGPCHTVTRGGDGSPRQAPSPQPLTFRHFLACSKGSRAPPGNTLISTGNFGGVISERVGGVRAGRGPRGLLRAIWELRGTQDCHFPTIRTGLAALGPRPVPGLWRGRARRVRAAARVRGVRVAGVACRRALPRGVGAPPRPWRRPRTVRRVFRHQSTECRRVRVVGPVFGIRTQPRLSSAIGSGMDFGSVCANGRGRCVTSAWMSDGGSSLGVGNLCMGFYLLKLQSPTCVCHALTLMTCQRTFLM